MTNKICLSNKKQIDLLSKNRYEIIETFGLVHDLENRAPIAYLLWDANNN